MTTTDEITLNVAGKKGYRIESGSFGTRIDLVRNGKSTKYYISNTFLPRKIVQVMKREDVEQSIETEDDKVLGIFSPNETLIGTISPIESEALSVIRDLYGKEKNPVYKKALEIIYNNTLNTAKWGFLMDASTRGIAKVDQ